MGVQPQVRAGRSTRAQSGAAKTPSSLEDEQVITRVGHHGQQYPNQLEMIGPSSMIDRVSYIRLLEQSLRSLGYEDVAESLESASGVQESSATARRFREAVLDGEINEALGLLGDLEEELVENALVREVLRQGGDGGVEEGACSGQRVRGWGQIAGGDTDGDRNTHSPGGRGDDGGGDVGGGDRGDRGDGGRFSTENPEQASTRTASIRSRVQRRVQKARYLLFCNLFRTLVEAGEAGKALKCLREDIQPLEGLLQAGGSGYSADRGDAGRQSKMGGGETGMGDVDMDGVSPGGDTSMHVDGRLAEFPPLSAAMDTLRGAAGLTFGNFPGNFGVLSSLNSHSGVVSTDGGELRGDGPDVGVEGNDITSGHPSLSTLASMLLQVNRGPPPLPPKRLREYEGVDIHRQQQLLDALQQLLSPEVLIPDNRLEALVEQALTAQIQRCPYHNSSKTSLSLMSDYHAGPESLPTVPVHTLTLHADEVWVVQFSPDGKWLVSASKDGSAILWDVRDSKKVKFSRILHSGRVPINIGAFSPSSREVLIGSNDGKIRVFKVSNGELITELTGRSAPGQRREDERLSAQHQDLNVSSAMWGNSSSQIALSCNKELRLLDIDISAGAHMPTLLTSIRLQNHSYDAVLSADGRSFVSVGQDRMIRYVRLVDGRVVSRGPEPAAVTCLSRSSDGKYLASNLANGCIHIWKLGDLREPGAPSGVKPRPDKHASDRFAAMPHADNVDPMDCLPDAPLFVLKGLQTSQPGRFVIRSAFGGVDDAFVGTGSENALVHIWHRETETLLASVEGHQATVNAVAWNPVNHHMLASASDDHKVIIWLSRQHLSDAE